MTKKLRAKLWTLSGLRLVCHCKPTQACHADSIIEEFKRMNPSAYDSDDPEADPPKLGTLNHLARLRMEPAPEDDSSADEDVPEKGGGWRGTGPPMAVGEGYAVREHCDGQTLASPGRWSVSMRRFPETQLWKEISNRFMRFAKVRGTPQQLMDLAVGKVENCPFSDDEIKALKRDGKHALEHFQ